MTDLYHVGEVDGRAAFWQRGIYGYSTMDAIERAEDRLERATQELATALFALEEEDSRPRRIALAAAKCKAKDALALWEEWELD